MLILIPIGTSLILGVVFLFFDEARPGLKTIVTLIFFLAVYLQFFSRYALPGLLLQIGLALYLAAWKKMDAAR